MIKTIFKRDSIFAERFTQVANPFYSYFIFQTLSALWQRNQKMRVNFIHLLCICTFLHGLPLLEAQPTTMEEEDTCSSLQTILLREEVLLLKEQFAAMSHNLDDSLVVQKNMLETIQELSHDSHESAHKFNSSLRDLQKLMGRHFISHIDPLTCFDDKSVSYYIPYCREGWLVIQRRMDGSVYFYRGWSDYRQGFGNPSGEFWIGLETMHSLTQSRTYKLRIDLEDFGGNTRYAKYSTFAISDEAHGFTLSIGIYSGTAGDALITHNNSPFLTKDHRGTGRSAVCPTAYKGAWWYNHCHDSNLNGQYLRGHHTSYADGVNWRQWKGYHYSLKTTIMMIKPVG